jgi:hypothetical protein
MPEFVVGVHPAQRSMGFHDPAAAIFEDGELSHV